jgi:hypothetical protein
MSISVNKASVVAALAAANAKNAHAPVFGLDEPDCAVCWSPFNEAVVRCTLPACKHAVHCVDCTYKITREWVDEDMYTIKCSVCRVLTTLDRVAGVVATTEFGEPLFVDLTAFANNENGQFDTSPPCKFYTSPLCKFYNEHFDRMTCSHDRRTAVSKLAQFLYTLRGPSDITSQGFRCLAMAAVVFVDSPKYALVMISRKVVPKDYQPRLIQILRLFGFP